MESLAQNQMPVCMGSYYRGFIMDRTAVIGVQGGIRFAIWKREENQTQTNIKKANP